MNWYALLWGGAKVVYIIEDRGSFIIWDEFGDLQKSMGEEINGKIIDVFDSFYEAKRFVEANVGKVVVK